MKDVWWWVNSFSQVWAGTLLPGWVRIPMVRTTGVGFLYPNSRLEFYRARANQFLHKLISKVLIKDASKMFWVLWEMLPPDEPFASQTEKFMKHSTCQLLGLARSTVERYLLFPLISLSTAYGNILPPLQQLINSFASNCIVCSQLYLSRVEEAAGETLGHSLRRVILNPVMGKRPKRSALQHSSQ